MKIFPKSFVINLVTLIECSEEAARIVPAIRSLKNIVEFKDLYKDKRRIKKKKSTDFKRKKGDLVSK